MRAGMTELDRYFADTTLQRTVHCQRPPRRLTGAGAGRSVDCGTLDQATTAGRGKRGEPGRRVVARIAAALVQGERDLWQESI
jgi:hypothetical protein